MSKPINWRDDPVLAKEPDLSDLRSKPTPKLTLAELQRLRKDRRDEAISMMSARSNVYIADLLGVSPKTVSRWRSEAGLPSFYESRQRRNRGKS